MDNSLQQKPDIEKGPGAAFAFAWELGYTIAIPLVALALVGRLLDRKLGTSPWLLLTGIGISMVVSTMGVYWKLMKIIGKKK